MQARANGFRWVKVPKKAVAVAGSKPIPSLELPAQYDDGLLFLTQSLRSLQQDLLEFNQANGIDVETARLIELSISFTKAALEQDHYHLIQIPHTMSVYGTSYVSQVAGFSAIDDYCAPINALNS